MRSVNSTFVVLALLFSWSVSVRQALVLVAAGTGELSLGERISNSVLGCAGSGQKTTISLISGRPVGLAAVAVGFQTTSVWGNSSDPACSVTTMQPGNCSLATAYCTARSM